MAGYCASRGGMQIIGGFWVYADILDTSELHDEPSAAFVEKRLALGRYRRRVEPAWPAAD
jgi:hypothetical protein